LIAEAAAGRASGLLRRRKAREPSEGVETFAFDGPDGEKCRTLRGQITRGFPWAVR
jgi:hypothetical protein